MRIKTFVKSLFGTKAFYAGVFTLIFPIIIQQGISSFVNLLDNVMVGQLGTEQMSSVAIVNQIVFVFNLAIFGGLAGASIFGAQFFGKGDTKGVRDTFRFKVWLSLILSIIGVLVMLLFGETLVQTFLNESEGDSGDIAATFEFAKEYLYIAVWGIVPFAFVQCFASTLKDTGETVTPMIASVIAILTNLVLNYLLIFGAFGFPEMGVAGAALATVIARFVELSFLVISTYAKKHKFVFIQGAFRSLRVPLPLTKKILRIGMPLLLNELFWALGTTMINQSYSLRGLSAVAATNINGTVWNVFSIIMMAMGNAIGIIVGQQLGANDIHGAKDTAKKLLCFNTLLNLGVGLIILAASPAIPYIYNTTDTVRSMATQLLIISGIYLPIDAYIHGTYFTIRSGGKTVITFLFDCVFTWAVSLPIAFCLANFTTLPLVWIVFFVQLANLIKVVIGTLMIKSGIWANNVVNDIGEKSKTAEAQSLLPHKSD